ncbi:deubiquitinase OTUD6B-like [Littorina saxatilis]|uniref:ubiquitinyl hydrolase 1 n=1 Tax=Littorina saxatilis TaxID=31220 RepID=A0AAN9C032_9CAEN
MADRDEILARHKTEKKDLQGECLRLKHGVPKGDKKRKKEVTEQIAQLEAEQAARHKQELQELDASNDAEVDGTAEALSKLSAAGAGDEDGEKDENDEELEGASSQQQSKKPSRAQKRRDKKTAKDRERDVRVKEAAITNLQGPRHQENLKLQALLLQRGLKIHQIPSDGNCMYNAVKHQVNQRGHRETNESLRQKTADLMRSKQDDFLPFLTHPETGDPYTPEKFEQYCEEVATTTAWGGHLELRAMSEALSMPMEVVQAEGPKVTVGEEYSGTPVTLVYHRHALGLGEHYNSVQERGPDDEDDKDNLES